MESPWMEDQRPEFHECLGQLSQRSLLDGEQRAPIPPLTTRWLLPLPASRWPSLASD